MSRLSDVLDRLRHFPAVVDDLATLREEMACLALDAPHASIVAASRSIESGYRPLNLRPLLAGTPIRHAIAVGWHGISATMREQHPAIDAVAVGGRFLAGRLVHAAKQYDTTQWATDTEDIQRIGSLAAWAMAIAMGSEAPNVLVPMPSSRGHNNLPALVARDLGFLTRIRVASAHAVSFGREVAEIKDMNDYWQTDRVLRGALVADAAQLRGRHVLIVDDVCRSGVTFRASADACRRGGARQVSVLAISKTWKYQRVPPKRTASGFAGVMVGQIDDR